ncbi:hypothetical protein CY35_15G044400 [Sphagnum magellanicum]|nr:hypothetical protein CY35_15G044400 [Sphagnum magellanicum]
MAVCACSMGLLKLLPPLSTTATVSATLSSQLRLERGVQNSDLPCAINSPEILSVRCACNMAPAGDNYAGLVQSAALESSGKARDLKRGKGQGGCNLQKQCSRNDVSLVRRPALLRVQARVQDCLEHECHEIQNRLQVKGGRGGKVCDRRPKTRVEHRQQQVEVITNNGFVELEEQLGVSKRTKEGSLQLKLSSKWQGNEVLKDEEGRLLQTRQEEGGAPPTRAHAASLVEIASHLASETEMSLALNDIPAEAIDVQVEEQSTDEHNKPSEVDADGWMSMGLQMPRPLVNSPGGQRVAELVAAWDGLARRLPLDFTQSSGSPLLLAALKLTVNTLQHAALAEDGRNPLVRALSVAYVLADLRMDAEVIAAGLLQEALEAGYLRISAVERELGNGVGRLLHDCARVKHMPSRMDTLDDDSANVVRQFCLAFHDVRAVVVVVSARLDVMRHVQTLPRYRQQILALETMQIYAPLAHVMGTGTMGLELEDLGFWVLFPDSYSYIESWLKRHWADGDKLVADSQQLFLASLEADPELQALIKLVTITGRCKSRYSTMKKLLKDGRQPEEVYDILGLRVVLTPKDGGSLLEEKERGVQACYRAMEIATSLWKELKGRLKDYIAAPKENGYESLHFTVFLGDNANWSPHMEIQIRTAAMHAMAEGGLASHSLYKGGLTDPEQAGYLKAIMLAAADVAVSRFSDLAGNAVEVIDREDRIYSNSDHIFTHFDKNQDGVISMDELQQVIRELGADSNDSHDLMRIVDSNLDGSVSAEEFQNFCRQVKIFENLAGVDKQFSTQLDQKLLTDSADITEGTVKETYATFPDGSSSSTYKDNINSSSSQYPFLQTSADLRPPSSLTNGPVFVEQPTTENIERMMMDDDITLHKSAKKSVNSSAVSESLDSPVGDKLLVEEPEKLMWIERIKGSDKSSTSTSVTQSGSDVRNKLTNSSITGLAKPEKPAHLLAWAKPKTNDTFQHDDKDLVLLQRSGQSTTVCRNEEEKVETMLTLLETDSIESSIDSELTEIRRQIISGDRAAARSSLTMLSRKHPNNAHIFVHFAQLERKGGDSIAAGVYYSKAVRAFKKVGDMGLAYVRALQAWGSLEAQSRHASRARHLFLESIRVACKEEKSGASELIGASVYGLHAWAMLEQQLGNWSKARSLLERAALVQPGNAVVHQTRALLEARVHNYAAARHHFRLAVDVAPTDIKCWQAWALFEASQQKVQKMRSLFKQALKVDPENMHSLQAWAHQEALLGTDESRHRARKLYQRCIEVKPDSVHAWQAWGILEQEACNFTGARNLFERGISANPHSVPCLQAYAHMERVGGNLKAAQRLLLLALSVEPENSAVLMVVISTNHPGSGTS